MIDRIKPLPRYFKAYFEAGHGAWRRVWCDVRVVSSLIIGEPETSLDQASIIIVPCQHCSGLCNDIFAVCCSAHWLKCFVVCGTFLIRWASNHESEAERPWQASNRLRDVIVIECWWSMFVSGCCDCHGWSSPPLTVAMLLAMLPSMELRWAVLEPAGATRDWPLREAGLSSCHYWSPSQYPVRSQ